jgi:DHA3 family tetracycline resistance protein-like MFS transporter
MTRLSASRAWLVYQGVDSFALALGWTVAPVFFVRELGMSPLELVLTGTALEVAYFLFEVPTGIVADTYSRRTSVVVAMVVMGASFVATGLSPGVVLVIGAAALMGFGWTFKSGAEDAWLADEVGLENVARSYQRGAQVARVGALAGIVTAVGLALVDLRLPIVAGGLVWVSLGVLLVLLMPETGFHPAPREGLGAVRSMARTGATGGRLIRSRPILLLVVGIAFFGGMSSEAFDRLWEAHFLVDVGVPGLAGLDPVVWFGVLGAGVLVLAILVAQPLVRRLERLDRSDMARVLLVFDAATIVGMLAFAFAGSFVLAVAVYWATRVFRSLAAPVYSTWLNQNVEDSRVRATVISMTNLGDSAGEWGGGPGLGVLGNVYGIRTALAAGALALTPALALYARAIRHHGREPELADGAQARPVEAL